MCCGPVTELLAEYQLQFYTAFNVFTYSLTEVDPHPVTTTWVPGEISESSKMMSCTRSLKVKGGSTWNFKLCFGSFRSLKISTHYLNLSYFNHVFWLGICKFYCVLLYFYALYTYGEIKRHIFWRIYLKCCSLCVYSDSGRVFLKWTDGYNVPRTVAYFLESYIQLSK